jgi:hypothetical protein
LIWNISHLALSNTNFIRIEVKILDFYKIYALFWLFNFIYRYIEGLNSEKQCVSDWEKNLTATPENTKTDENRLPTNWLAQGAGYHGNVTNALWALRDLMLKDTLSITRTVPFESLCKY